MPMWGGGQMDRINTWLPASHPCASMCIHDVNNMCMPVQCHVSTIIMYMYHRQGHNSILGLDSACLK